MTRTCLALAVLLTLTACGAQDSDGGAGGPGVPPTAPDAGGTPDAAAAGSPDGAWQLQSGRAPSGKIPRPDLVTLTISGQRLSGTAACNSYDGAARIEGERFRSARIAATEMGCLDRRIMISEERYLESLQAARRIVRDGDTLRITGRDVALEFVPVAPPEPATFEDTTWQLHTLGYGRGLDGTVSSTMAPGQVLFASDGRLAAETGCRTIRGRWEREGDTVTVTDLPRDDIDCAVGDQDDHIMAVLQSPFTVELEGRELWLQQAEGDLGLGYGAE